MAIIVVGGSNRGVGKTALVCGLIAALPEYRWTAVKISTHEHAQPALPTRQSLPVSASAPPAPSRASAFRHLFDKKTVPALKPEPTPGAGPIWEETMPGPFTDTARYLAAGAARALLVSAPDDLSDPLNQLWPRFGRGTNFIFESNRIVHHVRPDACLLIHAVAERTLPLPERKPSFLAAVRHADAMVAHARVDHVIPDGRCLAGPEPELEPDWEPERQRPPQTKPIFHLADLEHVSPEMLDWLRLRLDPLPHP